MLTFLDRPHEVEQLRLTKGLHSLPNVVIRGPPARWRSPRVGSTVLRGRAPVALSGGPPRRARLGLVAGLGFQADFVDLLDAVCQVTWAAVYWL